jgi:hypothetical protein
VETLKYCPVKQACWNKEQIPQAKDSGKRKGQKRKLGKRKIEIRKQKSQIPDFHF